MPPSVLLAGPAVEVQDGLKTITASSHVEQCYTVIFSSCSFCCNLGSFQVQVYFKLNAVVPAIVDLKMIIEFQTRESGVFHSKGPHHCQNQVTNERNNSNGPSRTTERNQRGRRVIKARKASD